MKYYLFLVFVALLAAIGDILIYRWSKSLSVTTLVIAILIWVLSLILFGLALRWWNRSLTITFALTVVIHALIVTLWEVAFQQKHFSRTEWLGLCLAMASIIVLELAQNHD